MKTQNVVNKLKFDKNSIFELNDQEQAKIDGGGSDPFSLVPQISIYPHITIPPQFLQ